MATTQEPNPTPSAPTTEAQKLKSTRKPKSQQVESRTCPDCGKSHPLTKAHWYLESTGRWNRRCNPCRIAFDRTRREAKKAEKAKSAPRAKTTTKAPKATTPKSTRTASTS